MNKDTLSSIALNTTLIRNIANQILSLVSDSNLIVLFPRPDYKGLGYIPQLFFVLIKDDYIDISLESTSSEKAVINFESRKSEYVSYNITSKPEVISIKGGILTSLYENTILEPLKKTIFGQSILRFSKNLVKQQFKERFASGVYYSFFCPTTGFYEIVTITSLRLKDTVYIDEIEIDVVIKVVKTFNMLSYKG